MSAIELSEYLSTLIAVSGLSKKEIAIRAGISRSSLYNLLSGQVAEAKLSTLINIATTLGIHPLDLIKIYFKGMCAPRSAHYYKGMGSSFVQDINYPDYSVVFCGQHFTKAWAVRNTGTEPWENLYLECQDQPFEISNVQVGLQPQEKRVAVPAAEPGETVEFKVNLKAPDLPCTVKSEWRLTDAEGNLIFPQKAPLYCLVKVAEVSF